MILNQESPTVVFDIFVRSPSVLCFLKPCDMICIHTSVKKNLGNSRSLMPETCKSFLEYTYQVVSTEVKHIFMKSVNRF